MNYIAVPNPQFEKPFAYFGKNYYIFFKAFNENKFYFQLYFHLNNFNKIRFIFKYPLKKIKITKTDAYNVEIPIEINEEKDNTWILYRFSPINYINKNLSKYKYFSSLKEITEDKCIFKSFEFCSTIHIRGIFITNKSLNLNKLPKEISLSSAGEKPDLNMYYVDLVENKEIKSKSNSIKESKNNSQNDIIPEEFKKEDNNEIDSKKSINNYKYTRTYQNYFFNGIDKDKENSKINTNIKSNLTSLSRSQKKLKINSSSQKSQKNQKIPLYPDPILSLNYIIGYTSKNCPYLKYNSFGDYDTNSNIDKETKINLTKKFFYYCSGSNIIKYDPYTKSQKIFMGHSRSITNFIIGCKGEIIFSGEEGPNPIIKIWKVEDCSCIKMLTTPLDKLKSLSESLSSKYLCVAGKEQLKELIIIFKIENLNNIIINSKKKVNYGINCVKFVPYSDNILISCGYENIKFYRIKDDTLYEKSVVIDKFAKNNNFLCIDFNKAIFGDNYTDKGKAFIGSSLGQVIQISCQSQELESIYLVDNSPILDICINEMFAVTGSEKGLCRVWKVDFKDFIMEAKHDSGICSVDISYDSMDVLIGGLNGSIGTLNINEKNYKTLIRSPNGDIKLLFVHPTNNFIFSVENYGNKDILKIWDLLNKDEIYEINSDGDLISCVSADMLLHFFAGFNSGIIKIYDFEKNKLLYQIKPFKSSVENIIFVQNFKIFIAMSNLGNLSIHDCSQNFTQIKIINIDKQCLYPDISLSIDKYFFAVNGEESKYISVRNSETFDLKNNVNLNNNLITKNKKEVNVAKKICLIYQNLLGVVLCDNTIRFYGLAKHEGIFIKEIKDLHIKEINRLNCSQNYNYFLTCGQEGLIKVWDMKMIFNNYISYQQFIGHSNSVDNLILIDSKGLVLSTSKNNGIYFWNVLGDVTNYNNEIIKFLENLGDSKFDINKNIQGNKKELFTEDMKSLHMQKKYYAENQDYKYIYNIIKENSKQDENDKEIIEEKGEEQGFKILPTYPVKDMEEKVIINLDDNDYMNQDEINKYKNQEIDIKNKLLFSSKSLPANDKNCFNEENKNDLGSKKIWLENKFCIGLSLNSMNNIVYNKEKNWFAFTMNNKIIIEYLIGERKQRIINSSKDEISCLLLSNDLKYLLAGIGKKNLEEYASIFIYETNNFSLIKKLNLHPKGIQNLRLSEDNKYLISLGTKEENSLCIWDFNKFELIEMKTVKYNYFSIVEENKNLINGNNKLKFITCSFDIITFWELNDENKLEHIDLTLDEILINNYKEYKDNDKNKEEFITGINLYEIEGNSDFNNNYILLSTNKGNILVLDCLKKILIKKFLLCNYPLTKILFSNFYFIACGEGPLLYYWYINKDKKYIDFLDFLEREQPNILCFNNSINSIFVSSKHDECILSTGNSDIYYINLNENKRIKISSSHEDVDVIKIYSDNNDKNIYTLGKEEYIRCWENDSFDQKYMILKQDQRPNNILFNDKNDILLTQYENSYLTAFNTKDLKSFGKIYIPNEDISQFNFIFDNNNLLLITYQINLYIISIRNYNPLSMIYCLIDIPKKSKYFPYEQNCSSIENFNLDSNKSYSAFSFSDGTICIYYMERNKGKIIYNLVDNFNLILSHSETYNDEYSLELYYNLTNFRSEYKCESLFAKKYNDVIICYHESLKAILIRNFINKTNMKIINLNYFPYCMDLYDNGKFIAIGTKEGMIAFIDNEEKNYLNNEEYKPIFYLTHYNKVNCVKFSHDSRKLFSSSRSEIIISNINI